MEPRTTLAERALAEVTHLIISGALPLGSEVNEAQLARQLGMSRGPIREAVRMLQGRNLVVRSDFQRARVVDLSGKEILEVFQLREGMESIACRLVTESASAELFHELDQKADIVRFSDTVPEFDLHDFIIRNCNNARIQNILLNDFYYLFQLYRSQAGDFPGRRPQAREEHWQIIRAMLKRDGELAESLMRQHINRAAKHLASNF